MKKTAPVLALLALAAGALAGCGGGGGGSTASFQLSGAVDRPASLDTAALRQQAAVTQTVTYTSGTTPQSRTYTGAGTWAVLNGAGIQQDASRKNDVLNRYVLATGADGYRVVFSLGELHPDFGNKGSVVAYAETSAAGVSGPIDGADGPFRISAPGDVKGGRYVSGLGTLDVRPSGSVVPAEGGGVHDSFAVSGAVKTPMRFDLAALQALPASTQTVGGASYTGVSLWTLLNTTTGLQTDSTLKNPSLSMYAVATGSDGYKALVSLGEIDPGFGNRGALVAYSVNGAPLGANGVARLVVAGDTKLGRSVSNLAAIEVFTADATR